MHVTSQGPESEMSVLLRSPNRYVKPLKMIRNAILSQRSSFFERQNSVLSHDGPVTPSREAYIASLVTQSRVYQSSVQFIPGSSYMTATVSGFTDASGLRPVKLSETMHVAPKCCSYSSNDPGFPCLYEIAILCEKNGQANNHTSFHENTWQIPGSRSTKTFHFHLFRRQILMTSLWLSCALSWNVKMSKYPKPFRHLLLLLWNMSGSITVSSELPSNLIIIFPVALLSPAGNRVGLERPTKNFLLVK